MIKCLFTERDQARREIFGSRPGHMESWLAIHSISRYHSTNWMHTLLHPCPLRPKIFSDAVVRVEPGSQVSFQPLEPLSYT